MSIQHIYQLPQTTGQVLTSTGPNVSPKWEASQAAGTVTTVMLAGSKTGTNYSTTSGTFVNVDGTNLAYTTTLPVGYKMTITATGTINVTSNETSLIGIADSVGGVLNASAFSSMIEAPLSFAVMGLVVGDGASHTVSLQWTSGSGTLEMFNASTFTSTAPGSPQMVVQVFPSS
jgi:hypothetical protein